MYSFADFEQIGIDNPAQPSPPKAQDPACIMYTSGTTGTCFSICHSSLLMSLASFPLLPSFYSPHYISQVLKNQAITSFATYICQLANFQAISSIQHVLKVDAILSCITTGVCQIIRKAFSCSLHQAALLQSDSESELVWYKQTSSAFCMTLQQCRLY